MKRKSSTRLPASDNAPRLCAEDLARAKLQVGGKVVSREEFTAAVNEAVGKRRVSVMLDGAVISGELHSS